jgi:hypothetical protein
VGLALGGWTLALYALTFLVVRRHYETFPPHYDSVGAFANLFDLVNQVHERGLLAATAGAFGSGMTWLQPAYALLLSWAPIKAPEWLISLNLVLLLAAQAAIVTYGRTVEFSRRRQVVAATLVAVPGGLYLWDGGIQDLRRDIQLILMATAILFLSLAYVMQPGWQRGAALGLLVGLAQWSRDNAASVIVIVCIPAIVLALARCRESVGPAYLARLALVPLGVFLLLALPYYAVTLPATLERYQYNVWGIGEDRVESLLAFWNMPLSVLLGGDSRFGGRVRVALATAALLTLALAGIGVLRRFRVVTLEARRLRDAAFAVPLASGVWVVTAVLLYNTLLLGYGARWHAVPFLPMIPGLVAIMIGLSGLVRGEPRAPHQIGTVAVSAGCTILLLSAPLRMVLNQQPTAGAEEISALRAATFEIAERTNGRPVAFLAYDTLSRHHARYYATQAGWSAPSEYEPVALSHGDPVDLDQPVRANDVPQELQARLDRTIRRWADFALVYADTSRYANPRESLWPYLLGRPVVDGLLADPAWHQVARFRLLERDLVLLENTTPGPARASLAGPPTVAHHLHLWTTHD